MAEVMTSVGARVIETPFRVPKANAFAERLGLTARSECLDWVLIRNERHAERVPREFVTHYNRERPHRSIDLEPPPPKLVLSRFEGGYVVDVPGTLIPLPAVSGPTASQIALLNLYDQHCSEVIMSTPFIYPGET
jgi:hypothetical protein